MFNLIGVLRLYEVVLKFLLNIPSSIYRCLRMLCDEKRFYSDGHACVVCEQICRRAVVADLTEEFPEVLCLLTKLLVGNFFFFFLAPGSHLAIHCKFKKLVIRVKWIDKATYCQYIER